MSKAMHASILGGTLLVAAAGAAFGIDAPTQLTPLDQGIDQATLQRFHHTDQGSRLVPAAWLAALAGPDGTGNFMDPANLRPMGFIIDRVAGDPLNPYGWPIGIAMTDPAAGGLPFAGFTCAACHTGEIVYEGTHLRIDGAPALNNLGAFVAGMAEGFVATNADPARQAQFFADAIAAGYPAARIEADFAAALPTFAALSQGAAANAAIDGPGRQDAVQGIANLIFSNDLGVPANRRLQDAPVSIPFLWDTWRLSRVQTNGFAPGQNSIGRNIGEVLGVFGRTNFVDRATGTPNPEPQRWETSVQLGNMLWLEDTLRGLAPPPWPADILGAIDEELAAEGRDLFAAHCSGCHGIATLPDGTWDAPVIALATVGTDPTMAANFASRMYDATILGLGDALTTAEGLEETINPIRRQLYVDNATPLAQQEGDAQLLAPCGYKARPLIGVWATAPFLHNGSVRTIFDVLSDTRPAAFAVGTRDYDPVQLGYVVDPDPDAFVLDTTLTGNSNEGHWWTDDLTRHGRLGRAFTDTEKYAIIEFLKAAEYETYPTATRTNPAPIACATEPDWAK